MTTVKQFCSRMSPPKKKKIKIYILNKSLKLVFVWCESDLPKAKYLIGLEFIFSCLHSTMQQYQDLKLNPFKICNFTTCFGLLHHQAVSSTLPQSVFLYLQCI
jgi:hypothetical protein